MVWLFYLLDVHVLVVLTIIKKNKKKGRENSLLHDWGLLDLRFDPASYAMPIGHSPPRHIRIPIVLVKTRINELIRYRATYLNLNSIAKKDVRKNWGKGDYRNK